MAALDSTRTDAMRRLVYDFFADECEVDASEIRDETKIIEELEGDSLMLLALLRKVCSTYEIGVELKALGKHLMKRPAETVGDIVRLTDALVEHGDAIIGVDL